MNFQFVSHFSGINILRQLRCLNHATKTASTLKERQTKNSKSDSKCNTMGEGVVWKVIENCDLARAWGFANENPFLGLDQTSSTFPDTIFRKFCELKPSNATGKQYDGRTVKSCQSKIDNV